MCRHYFFIGIRYVMRISSLRTTKPKNFIIDLSDFYGENGVEVEFYLLDETHNCDLVGKATYYGNRFIPELILPNFSCYLLKLKKK